MKEPSRNRINAGLKEALEHLSELVDVYYDENQLRKFASVLVQTMHKQKDKFTNVSNIALYETTKHLLGKTPDKAMIKGNILRIIANWNLIEEGQPIPVWDGSTCLTDVVFLGVLRARQPEGSKPKLLVRCKLKSGLCAGIIRNTMLPASRIGQFLDHVAGVGSYHCSTEEIAGMETRAFVDYAGNQLNIYEWKCTGDQKADNRKLTEARTDAARCIDAKPCNVCRKDITQCPLAVWLPRPKKETTECPNKKKTKNQEQSSMSSE